MPCPYISPSPSLSHQGRGKFGLTIQVVNTQPHPEMLRTLRPLQHDKVCIVVILESRLVGTSRRVRFMVREGRILRRLRHSQDGLWDVLLLRNAAGGNHHWGFQRGRSIPLAKGGVSIPPAERGPRKIKDFVGVIIKVPGA